MAEDQSTGKRILGAAEVKRSLVRIAHEVVERNRGVDDVILLGIPSGGVPLARRLGEALSIALAEDAALTNSPWSLSQAKIIFEVIFLPVGSSSFASS